MIPPVRYKVVPKVHGQALHSAHIHLAFPNEMAAQQKKRRAISGFEPESLAFSLL